MTSMLSSRLKIMLSTTKYFVTLNREHISCLRKRLKMRIIKKLQGVRRHIIIIARKPPLKRCLLRIKDIYEKILDIFLKRKKIVFFTGWYRWTYNCPIIKQVFKRNVLTRLRYHPLSFEEKYVKSLVDITQIIKRFWEENDICNYKFLKYENLNLWELSKSSIFVKLTKCSIENKQDMVEVKNYFNYTIHLIECFKRLFKTEKPYAIFVEQGLQYNSRTAVEIARMFGIKTIAMENSFIKDLIFIDSLSGAICNRHTLSRVSWDRIKARELTEKEKSRLNNYLKNYRGEISQSERESVQEIRRKLKIKPEKRVALLIAQVITDGVIAMDSYIYKDIVKFIRDTITLFKDYPEYHLVVRLHPKESYGADQIARPYNNVTFERLKKLNLDKANGVSIVHSWQVNTYSLMDLADFAITINSQAGLEMLSKHKSVIVLGDAFYGRKGFTYDVGFKECYPVIVKKLIMKPEITERQKRDIDKFFYYMIFEYLFPRDLRGSEEKVLKIVNKG